MASSYQTPKRGDLLKRNLPDDFQAAGLEFVGTTVFLLIGLGGIQAATAGSPTDPNGIAIVETSKVSYIATVMGLSLLISAWLFFRVTGGLFNPNISLALLICGIITPVRFVLYCIAQLLGGIAAAALVYALTPGPLSVHSTLDQNINLAQGVFMEMFITAVLCLSVLMLAAEKHQATPFAPVGVGLTLFACHLFAVPYTGAGMNVARVFGPALVTGFPHSNHWVYWVGDGLGSLLAGGFYVTLIYFRYWKLNPNQDSVDEKASPPAPTIVQKLAPNRASRELVRGHDDNMSQLRASTTRTNDSLV